jgi:hypothetical protein
VHERDYHVDRLLMTLHGLFPIPRAWYSGIKELTHTYFYLCDFNRCDRLVLILYGDVFSPRDVLEN